MPEVPDWLVVDAEDGVVDPYHVLELSPGEPDAAVIREALARARARVEDPGSGHSADDRLALRDVLDRVEGVLTDPKRKRAYDEYLESRGREARPRAGRRGFRIPGLAALPADQRRKLAVTVAALAVTAATAGPSLFRGPRRFPKRISPPPIKGSDMESARLPTPPRQASVPGLTIGVPRKLSGLQDEKGATALTLSADLRILVFSREVGRGRGSDLFLTTRKGPREPFAKPQPMGAINTPGSERSPTLSGDGLELIFVRDGRAFATNRASRSGRFRPPTPLTIPGIDPEREAVTAAQTFADGLSVAFRVREKEASAGSRSRYVIAERAAIGSEFERAATVEVLRPSAAHAFSADGLRDYADFDDGLSLSTRRGLASQFGKPGLIQRLMASEIGPIEGSFWITPGEDVLFYASPGPDADRNLSRSNQPLYLWQILIR